MMHGEFGGVPDDGGYGVALLQRLVDQILSGLSRGSQHGDLHPHTLTHTHTQLSQGGSLSIHDA